MTSDYPVKPSVAIALTFGGWDWRPFGYNFRSQPIEAPTPPGQKISSGDIELGRCFSCRGVAELHADAPNQLLADVLASCQLIARRGGIGCAVLVEESSFAVGSDPQK